MDLDRDADYNLSYDVINSAFVAALQASQQLLVAGEVIASLHLPLDIFQWKGVLKLAWFPLIWHLQHNMVPGSA